MRALLVIAASWASASLAQPGVWGGYVTGWQPDPPRLGTSFVPGYVGDTQLAPPVVRYPSYGYVAPGFAWPAAYSSFHAEEEAERAQARLAQQQALAAQQEQLERERERTLAAEAQLLAQQQQLALQQQLLAQQQQQALMEEQARAAEREAKAELERKALAEQEAARLRAEAAAKPREKGPDIHRWVDDEGVVHYSTRPRR